MNVGAQMITSLIASSGNRHDGHVMLDRFPITETYFVGAMGANRIRTPCLDIEMSAPATTEKRSQGTRNWPPQSADSFRGM